MEGTLTFTFNLLGEPMISFFWWYYSI